MKCKSFPGGSVVKNLPANAKDMCFIPRTERSLEKEMATRSSILAWKTPWTEDLGDFPAGTKATAFLSDQD